METPIRGQDAIKILYIAGYQRSGSTILQNVLGQYKGYYSVGELRTLWDLGLAKNRPCGCGESFLECPVWHKILNSGFGGSDRINPSDLLRLMERVRTRNLFFALNPVTRGLYLDSLRPLQSQLERLYCAIQRETGCQVIIDSSKTPLYALALRGIPNLDLHILHLVRDARGAEYSLQRRKEKGHPQLQNHNSIKGSSGWMAMNLATEIFLRKPSDRYLRLRYEDFIGQPEQTIAKIQDFSGIKPNQPAVIEGNKVYMNAHHTIGGSPHRFSMGEIELRPDDEWKKDLDPNDRAVVTLMTGPLLRRYGYEGVRDSYLQAISRIMRVGMVLSARGVGSVLNFVLNIFLGRVLGADGTGIFYLFFSWMRTLGTLGDLGLPQYTLRSLSVLEGKKSRVQATQFFLSALGLALLATALIAALVGIAAPFLAQALLESETLAYVLRLASISGIFFVAVNLLGKSSIARGRPTFAIVIENSAIPLGLVSVLLLALLTGTSLNAQLVLWIYLVVSLVTTAIALWTLLHDRIRPALRSSWISMRSHFHPRNLAAFWGLGISRVAFNNLPFLMLPQFATAAEIGQFGVTHRFVTMAVTILEALTSLFAPRFAQHFAGRNWDKLSRDLRSSQLYSLLAYLPFVLVYIFLAEFILGIVGPEFREARDLLWIMTIGQLISAGTGLAGLMLNMTNQEKPVFYNGVAFTGIMALMVVVLGRSLGVYGVAWAFSLTFALRAIVLYGMARKHMQSLKQS